MNDPLDELLSPPDGVPDERLRTALFSRTTRTLRWRRRRRQIAWTICAAGILLLALLPPSDESVTPREVIDHRAPPVARPVEPVALEWRALDHPEEATALYREAADRYLATGEASEAMRCYANSLDEADALNVQADDSWLLIAIKHARKKELNP